MPIGADDPNDDSNGEDDENGENGDSTDVDEEKIEELIERTEELVELAESEPEMEFDITDAVESELDVLSVRQKGIEDRMDSLEDELSNFQSRLERLLFGPEDEVEGRLQGEEPSGDLWDRGDKKPPASSIGQYKRLRGRASADTDTVSPFFGDEFEGVDTREGRMRTYFNLYREHYASMREIYNLKATGDEWEIFVEELVKYYGVTREAVESDVENVPVNSGIFLPFVDIIDPDPSYFGIFEHGEGLTIEIDDCPIPFLIAYDDFYFADTNYDLATDTVTVATDSSPWSEMEVDEPEEFSLVQGMDYRTFNFNAFATIQSKDKYTAPDWMTRDFSDSDLG